MNRQDVPAERCDATFEQLKEDGLKNTDQCPICEDYYVLCRVIKHPKVPNPPQDEIGVSLKFTFKNKSSKHSVNFQSATLDTLRDAVMEKWVDFCRCEFHFEYNGTTVNDITLTTIIKEAKLRNSEVALDVIDECKGFSYIKDESEFLSSLSIATVKDNDDEFQPAYIDETTWKSQIDHCLLDLKNKSTLYGSIVTIGEASVREHVSPVLSLAALVAGDILMKAEQRIQGLHGWGPLDYLYIYKKFPVTITEVKRDQLVVALAQNDAQLLSSRQDYLYHNKPADCKKRKYLEIDISSVPSFGIVTNGGEWIFRKLVESRDTDGMLSRTLYSSKVHTIDLVEGTIAEIKYKLLKIVRCIVKMLQDQKLAVDENPVTKKVRNEF